MIALLSEYHLLTWQEKQKITWIIVDDGTWTEEQIKAYVDNHFESELVFHPDDWTKG